MEQDKREILIFDQELLKERKYWMSKLNRELEAVSLAPDYPRTEGPGGKRDTFELNINGEVYEKLLHLTKNGPFLLYTTLMAALKVCLYKYTGSDSIVVGSPARLETDGASSSSSNALAIVDNINPQATFREFLLQVRQTLLEAYERQGYPFERLIQDVRPGNAAGRFALFDVALVLKDIHRELPYVSNDLTITFNKEPHQLCGHVSYRADLFKPESIERFVAHYRQLLRAILENTNRRLCELEMLTEAERNQLLWEWNATRKEYPVDKCIHQLFEEQAERTPDALALEYEDERVSYRELNERANQLAHYLRGQGVGPEQVVGVSLERSIEMIVSLLAVLKAGGAYLPLDPQYPVERLSFMLEDARVSIVLTQQSLVERLQGTKARLICVAQQWEKLGQYKASNPLSAVDAGNLAYVIYTSGSTGQPKGVMVEHRSVCNMASAQVQAFEIKSVDRILQFASLNFDASVSEIFTALISGACLYLSRSGMILAGRELLKTLSEKAITTATIPPSVLAVLPCEPLKNLRAIVSAGEQCSAEIVNEWASERRFYNAYGPTEATVCASLTRCTPGESQSPTIGRPIANVQIYILDEHLQPVPVGVPGQLFISGDGLARGYLNLPSLSALNFIPHPFSSSPGARLYKSGDLARLLPDGSLHFLSRLDGQVKLRGFRIELGEIEAVLRLHPLVREAVVLMRQDRAGEKRLVAYLVAQEGEQANIKIESKAVREYMRERVPEHMIPSVVMQVDAMPLTVNGKVDRRALPAPTTDAPANKEEHQLSHTPVQEMLAGIWMEVLKVEQVRAGDDFLELGGHSLLATQLASRIRDVFGVELSLRSLFSYPSLAAMAEQINEAVRAERGVLSPPIEPVMREQPLPLSFAQQRLWFLDQLEPGSSFYNISGAMLLQGHLDLKAFEQTFNEIIRRHEVLRTTFDTIDGLPVQIINEAQALSLPVTDLTHIPEKERETKALSIASEEARQPFDLSRGPVLRLRLLRLREDEHIALLTMHHIVGDGWSVGVLFREVAALYEAYAHQRVSPLAELEIQYADYAVWQREWLQGEILDQQLGYWKRQLSALPVLDLPTDRPRPSVQTFRGANRSFQLPSSLSDSLERLSRQEGVTLFMTLLAAFQLLLSRYTSLEDLAVGSAIAGRNRAETESLIGLFVNTLVLRTDLSGNPTFKELLRRVREMALGAYAHQEVPFDKLVEELQPVRDPSRSPLVQVAFGLQNAPVNRLQLPQLQLRSVEVETTTARFDLTLWLTEGVEGLQARWTYNTDLFEEETIRRMQGHFETLLQSIVDQPKARVQSLNMLTIAEADKEKFKELEYEEASLQSLMSVRRKTVIVSQHRSA